MIHLLLFGKLRKEVKNMNESRSSAMWICDDEEEFAVGHTRCSNCRTRYDMSDLAKVGETGRKPPNYCPHCGAKMNAHEIAAYRKEGSI